MNASAAGKQDKIVTGDKINRRNAATIEMHNLGAVNTTAEHPKQNYDHYSKARKLDEEEKERKTMHSI